MKNPLPPIGLFTTPKDSNELWAYVERFSGSEKVIAMTAACMTWNLCSKVIDQMIAEAELAEGKSDFQRHIQDEETE